MSEQVVCPPPVSVCGLHETELSAEFPFCGGSRVSACERPLARETEAGVLAVTAAAVMVNVALVIPAPIATAVGMVRLPEDEISGMEVLDGAGLARVMVHVPVPGVWMVVGVQIRVAFNGW